MMWQMAGSDPAPSYCIAGGLREAFTNGLNGSGTTPVRRVTIHAASADESLA